MPQRAPTGRIELKPTQERVLTQLKEDGTSLLTRGRYEEIAGVSRSQAAYDLAELVDSGILERIGGGRATRYRLVRRERPGKRRWTSERIRSALQDFCGGREAWPSASEFKAAGHSDLYVAASRYGGVGFWATELGFPQTLRARPQAPARPWRPRLGWASGGAAFAAALFAAAGAAVYLGHGAPAHETAAPQESANPAAARLRAPAQAKANVRSRKAAPKTKPAAQAQQRARTSSTSAGSPSAASSGQAQLASATVSTPSHSSVSMPRQDTAQRTTSSGSGPAPLAPPASTGTAPAPLPPPAR